MKPIKYNDVRFTIDDRNESLGKKIREATAVKIPIQIIVGPKDQAVGQVSIRTHHDELTLPLKQLASYLHTYGVAANTTPTETVS